jgi:hypothetical protein
MSFQVETISNVDAFQRKILRYIAARGELGATSDEMEAAFDMVHSTVSPRVRELFVKSYLRDSGLERITRKGRMATVWVLNMPSAKPAAIYDYSRATA